MLSDRLEVHVVSQRRGPAEPLTGGVTEKLLCRSGPSPGAAWSPPHTQREEGKVQRRRRGGRRASNSQPGLNAVVHVFVCACALVTLCVCVCAVVLMNLSGLRAGGDVAADSLPAGPLRAPAVRAPPSPPPPNLPPNLPPRLTPPDRPALCSAPHICCVLATDSKLQHPPPRTS